MTTYKPGDIVYDPRDGEIVEVVEAGGDATYEVRFISHYHTPSNNGTLGTRHLSNCLNINNLTLLERLLLGVPE